jgi:hypothetical protein
VRLYTGLAVEDVYTIGLFTGLGASLGVALAGALAGLRSSMIPAALLAAAGAAAAALLLIGWPEAVGGGVGGALGGGGAALVVGGTLRRGGTRAGTAFLVTLVALVGAALALVPLVGYLEAVAVPALAARLRRRAGEKYAGLRTLAKP